MEFSTWSSARTGKLRRNSFRLRLSSTRADKQKQERESFRSRVSCGMLEKTALGRKCISTTHSPSIASFGRREQKHSSPVLSLSFRLSTDAVSAATPRGSGVKQNHLALHEIESYGNVCLGRKSFYYNAPVDSTHRRSLLSCVEQTSSVNQSVN